MCFLAQTDEVLYGSQSTRKTEDHVDRNQATELQPGERRPVDAEPYCLTNDNIGFGRRLAREAAMNEVDNRQNGAGDRHQHQHKEAPS